MHDAEGLEEHSFNAMLDHPRQRLVQSRIDALKILQPQRVIPQDLIEDVAKWEEHVMPVINSLANQ